MLRMLLQAAPPPDVLSNPLNFGEKLVSLAEQHSGRLALALALIGAVAVARVLIPKVHGKLGALVATNRGSLVLTFILSLVGAVASAVWAGGQLNGALVLVSVEVSFMAAGGWSALRRVLPKSWVDAIDTFIPPNPPAPPNLTPPLDLSGAQVQPPPSTKAKGMVHSGVLVAIALAGLLGVAFAGCVAYCKVQANVNTPVCKVARVASVCGEPEVVRLVLAYLPEVVVDLVSANYSGLLTDLVAQIEKLGTVDGGTVISCTVKTVTDNSGVGAAVSMFMQPVFSHAQDWLKAHPIPKSLLKPAKVK